MSLTNFRRQMQWLWKHRHTHDGDTTQQQITVIRTIVEEHEDGISAAGSGAYIHLLASSQVVDGGFIEWTGNHVIEPFEFTVELPTDSVTVRKPGYYDVSVRLGWNTFRGGGLVRIIRVRDGLEQWLWPPAEMGNWESTSAQEFEATAKGIPFEHGDTVKVFLDAGSAQNLGYASLVVELIDRFTTESVSPWELVFAADNWGITWDPSEEEWWTTDATDNANPALFRRSPGGTILNSYTGYDPHATSRNRGVVYAGGTIYGVGHHNSCSRVDPSDGSKLSQFTVGSPGNALQGITHNGTNLFISDTNNNRVEEWTAAGSKVQNIANPAGRTLRGLAWDGTGFWATVLGTQDVVRLDSSFDEVQSMAGPTATNRGCHYRDGFLYVMTATGLYRGAV